MTQHTLAELTTFPRLQELFAFDSDRLAHLAETHRESYASAKPFPHVVMDDFLPAALLRKVLDEFPTPEQVRWVNFGDDAQKKLASREENQMGLLTRLLLYQLNSSVFMNFLEALTGIEGLIPDPYFGGGGLHQIERGGYLKVHADFNWHPKLQLDRRINLLIYLNENWLDEYGGHLELWDAGMTHSVQKILPVFNRCVIFTTTDLSYHGHPDPLTCPEGRTRKSLALYYYTNGRPVDEKSSDHNTLFQRRPGEQMEIPGEPEPPPPPPAPPKPHFAKIVIRKMVPPILLDAWGYLTGGANERG